MKRILSTLLLFIVLFTLSSCGRTMISILSNEPSLSGTVIEIQDQTILIENETNTYLVSTTNIENPNGMTHFTPGDVVTVYYDGVITQTNPPSIETVYVILLTEPALRAQNNVS